jgi:hypothetical protein
LELYGNQIIACAGLQMKLLDLWLIV